MFFFSSVTCELTVAQPVGLSWAFRLLIKEITRVSRSARKRLLSVVRRALPSCSARLFCSEISALNPLRNAAID